MFKVQQGDNSKENAIESIREKIVFSGKVGYVLAIYMDNLIPDWKNAWTVQKEGEFDTNLIFNCREFKKEENYKKMLKKNEDVDDFGNKGYYLMHKDYQMVLVYSYQSEDQIQKIKDSIPFYKDSFKSFIVSF